MLRIDRHPADRVLVLSPDGALTQGDIERLSRAFDEMRASGDKLRGIVIHAPNFPGWASWGAFRDHVKFVRAHQHLIERLAISTDSLILQNAPLMARLFLKPEVGVFTADELETALEWAAGK